MFVSWAFLEYGIGEIFVIGQALQVLILLNSRVIPPGNTNGASYPVAGWANGILGLGTKGAPRAIRVLEHVPIHGRGSFKGVLD
jgi:hypothetical protein